MRVFILEDDPTRIQLFREAGIGHDLVICESIEGIGQEHPMRDPKGARLVYPREVMKAPFDYLFLDHDLGGRVYVDSDEEETGATFTRLMPPQVEGHDDPKVIVHSYNRAGAVTMVGILRDKGYDCVWVPFGEIVLNVLRTDRTYDPA